MSIPVSTVPAVKAALKVALEARAELANVPVFYSIVTDLNEDDLIVVGGTRGRFEVARMVGSGAQWWLDETYDQQVEVWVYRGGDDEQATEERAHTLAAVVVDTLRLDPSIGGRVNQATPAGFEVTPDWEHEGIGTHCKYLLHITVDASV